MYRPIALDECNSGAISKSLKLGRLMKRHIGEHRQLTNVEQKTSVECPFLGGLALIFGDS
jgi:hypothetical protein